MPIPSMPVGAALPVNADAQCVTAGETAPEQRIAAY